MRAIFRFSFSLLLFSTVLFAQSVGTVQGTVTDPTGAVIPGAHVSLTSAISGYKQSAVTDASGMYRFQNVPYAQFTVHAEAPGFDHGDMNGELRSNIPLTLNLQLPVATSQQTVEVTEQAPLLETTSSGTHHDLDYTALQKMPIAQAGRGIEQVVQQVPGVVADDNGRVHVRGTESEVQYVVDGVPITQNMSATFSTALSVNNLRTAEVMTGNIPAEYGDKLGAVVNVNTKSGLEMPWTGSISLGGGSFASREAEMDFGGHWKDLGVYLNASGSDSDRYLDPPEIQNFHNHGGNGRVFTKLDWNAGVHDVLRLSLSTNGSDLQVPNRAFQQSLGVRTRQELRDDSQSLGWNHIFNDTTVADLVLFRRASTGRLLDPTQSGFPFYAVQDRHMREEGLRLNISNSWRGNNFKFGTQFVRTPLREQFTVAATDPAITTDLTNPLSAFPLATPFNFNQRTNGKQAAFFAQDRFTLFQRLTIDAGVRFDHYDILIQRDHWSPRIGLAYFIKRSGTVLRASYNNLFQTPPKENLLLSSSQAGAVFSPIGSLSGVRAVPPETQNFYEFGFQQTLGPYVRFDVSRYVKNIRNFSDKDQLLETGIIFPVAISRGDIRGTEARLDLTPFHGWTAYLGFANSKAVGTTPIAGGLFLGDVNDQLLIPGFQFAADHDQRNTGQFGVTYNHSRSGAWFNFEGRHESGVPAEVDPAEFASLDPRIVENLDPVRNRVKPRTIFDFATGIDLAREKRFPVSLQLSVRNLADRFFLYNFESVFSGTHIGRPREVSFRAVFRFQQKKK